MLKLKQLLRNPVLLFLAIMGSLLLVGLLVFNRPGSSSAVNPATDKDRSAEEGTDYAALYKHGELYNAVENNDLVLQQIKKDLLLFARSTRSEFANTKTLVGFTILKQLPKEGEASVFTGRFYGVGDEIRVAVTPHGRGVYTLSITNLADQTNIDEYLGLNGKRNRFIKTLPLQKGRYSIRHQLSEDRIVVTFYDGYTAAEVDEVVSILQEALGDEYVNDVVFSINRKGIFPLEVVRLNITNPISEP